MAYENQCGSCEYFNDQYYNKSYDMTLPDYVKGHCTWYKCFYYPDDSCDHYIKRGTAGGGCYITTIVCYILGYKDDCETLNNLRKFRNDILQKDEKYKEVLFSYDSVGPGIAYSIKKDYDKNKNNYFASLIYSYYIEPISNLVTGGNREEAINKYMEMTNCLQDTFGIMNSNELDSYDYNKGGHGYIYKK